MLEGPDKSKLFTLLNQVREASKKAKVFYRRVTTPPRIYLHIDSGNKRRLLKITYNIVDRKLSIDFSTHHREANTYSFYLKLHKMLTTILTNISGLNMSYHERGTAATITCFPKNKKRHLTINQVLGVSLASSHFLAPENIRSTVFQPLIERFCALNSNVQVDDLPDLCSAMASLGTSDVVVGTAALVQEGAVLPEDTITVEAYAIPPVSSVVESQVASAESVQPSVASIGAVAVMPQPELKKTAKKKRSKFPVKLAKTKSTLDCFSTAGTVEKCLEILYHEVNATEDVQETKDLIKMFLLQINDIWNKDHPGIQITLADIGKIKASMVFSTTLRDALQKTLLADDRTYNLLPAHLSQLIDPFYKIIAKTPSGSAAGSGGGGGN
jgi:hypothetical protein